MIVGARGGGSDSIPLSRRADSTQVVDFLEERRAVEKAETAQLGADCSKIVQNGLLGFRGGETLDYADASDNQLSRHSDFLRTHLIPFNGVISAISTSPPKSS
jgi:hypothetical protein